MLKSSASGNNMPSMNWLSLQRTTLQCSPKFCSRFSLSANYIYTHPAPKSPSYTSCETGLRRALNSCWPVTRYCTVPTSVLFLFISADSLFCITLEKGVFMRSRSGFGKHQLRFHATITWNLTMPHTPNYFSTPQLFCTRSNHSTMRTPHSKHPIVILASQR